MKFSRKAFKEVLESISIIFILNLRVLIFYWVFYFKHWVTLDFKKILNSLSLKINFFLLDLWFLIFKSKMNLLGLKKKYFPNNNIYSFQNKLRHNNWILCTTYISKQQYKKIIFIPKITWLFYF